MKWLTAALITLVVVGGALTLWWTQDGGFEYGPQCIEGTPETGECTP